MQKKKYDWWMVGLLCFVVVAVFYLAIASGEPPPPSKFKRAMAPVSTYDPVAAEKRRCEEVQEVEKTLTMRPNPKECTDLESIEYALDRLDAAASSLRFNNDDTAKCIQDAVKKLKPVAVKALQTDYPALRKQYIAYAARTLWEENIEVTGSGRTIQFTGGMFASNKNIKRTQETLSRILNRLRFKRVEYRWYRGASEYTSYTLSNKGDGEL